MLDQKQHNAMNHTISKRLTTTDRAPVPVKAEVPMRTDFRPNRFCFISNRDDEKRVLKTVIEQKAPFKLSEVIFQKAEDKLPELDIYNDIVHNPFLATDEAEHQAEQCRDLIAAAFVQEFTYMLEGGLIYGCLETGQVSVFFKLDEDEEEKFVLFYHIAIPS